MPRKRRLRLLGFHAVLIASTIQGMMPDGRGIVSPWALEWLQVAGTIGGSPTGDGRIPGDDRPSPSGDDDGTSAEVVLPGDLLASTAPSRRPGASHSHPFASIGHAIVPDAPASRYSARPRRRSESVGDRISSLCRFTC